MDPLEVSLFSSNINKGRRHNVTTCIIGLVLLVYFVTCVKSVEVQQQFCPKPSRDDPRSEDCHAELLTSKVPRYILYDVNPPEGFNLRRDVYMRMAIFASKLPKTEDWHLVLPPWDRLYHWRSTDVGKQSQLPWSLFFNIQSMQKFAPVVEMYDFLNDGRTTIDHVFVLQHYKDMFEEGYKWEEKYDIEPCQEEMTYRLNKNGTFSGHFWGYANVTAHQVDCLSFHGLASQLGPVASNFTSVMFDHAEVALHDSFGDALYWRARRSMRFAEPLKAVADEFRTYYFNSTDESDGTVLPDDWMDERSNRNARGGRYICAHLRRRDFLWGRPKDVPSVRSTATQIKLQLQRLTLDSVFVATDAPIEEIEELKDLLPGYRVVHYEPTPAVRSTAKDGGVAIIEQIICSHAAYFIGTHESTFSLRIQEEREILGFPINSTFNRLCGDGDNKCSEPSRWKIVY